MTAADLEMEASPETASYRHQRRRAWQAIRAQYEHAVAGATLLGLGEDEARPVAARAGRGELRAFMSELLTRAPVPAVLEFLDAGLGWGVAGERLLEQQDGVLALLDSAYPRPTWTETEPLAAKAAEDDATWSAWIGTWAQALRATGPAAEKALAPRPPRPTSSAAPAPKASSETLSRWAPWLASAAAIVGATTIVVVATRD